MELLGWLLAYVVGFGLVQLLLYRYVRRDDPSPDVAPDYADRPVRGATERVPAPVEGGDETAAGVTCRHCGAVNEPDGTFSYCRECVGPLQ